MIMKIRFLNFIIIIIIIKFIYSTKETIYNMIYSQHLYLH